MKIYKFISCFMALLAVLCLGLTACGEKPGAETATPTEPTPPVIETPIVEPTPAVSAEPTPTVEPTPIVSEQPTFPQGESYTLNADGRTLTLVLEAEKEADGDFYRVDALKVYDGAQLLSTTDTTALEYEGDYLFDGVFFLRGEDRFWDPIVEDFNFDGCDDLCLMASNYSPKNIPFAYFQWNESEQRLDFSFVLSNPLTVDDQNRCLIECIIGPAGSYEQYNTYQFDEQGKLTLVQNKGEEQRNQLICDYYAQTYQCDVYMLGEEPSTPLEGDLHIEEIAVLGETRSNEVTGQLLELRESRYSSSGWQEYRGYLVVTRGMDNVYEQVIGIPLMLEDLSVEEIIQQEIWGLSDLEVSLFRDGYPNPTGPGTGIPFCREVYDGPETVEVRNDWEPIHYEGDYWAIHRWSGVEAICYHRAADGGYGVNTFDTTRTDLRTYRGVRVGDSRETVKVAYPELKSGDYWGKYTGEDYLWYCASDIDLGPAIIFFFENDVVSRIVLIDMFN